VNCFSSSIVKSFTIIATPYSLQKLFGKNAHVATTHNELIKDPRFVLVGRGLYALKSWGYMNGIVKDVIVQILEKYGSLGKDEIMEHVLRVNAEEVWHDSSDGIILSTPIGSSAYSMSAGGPVIFQDSGVFGIISVNSLDVTRRPLIVSNSSLIEIDDISSRLHCEVILDGLDRFKVNRIVEATKFSSTAKIS